MRILYVVCFYIFKFMGQNLREKLNLSLHNRVSRLIIIFTFVNLYLSRFLHLLKISISNFIFQRSLKSHRSITLKQFQTVPDLNSNLNEIFDTLQYSRENQTRGNIV